MSTQKVKIVSDGTAIGTQVLVDGVPLQKVVSIDFKPVLPGGVVFAVVSVLCSEVELDITADAEITGHQA